MEPLGRAWRKVRPAHHARVLTDRTGDTHQQLAHNSLKTATSGLEHHNRSTGERHIRRLMWSSSWCVTACNKVHGKHHAGAAAVPKMRPTNLVQSTWTAAAHRPGWCQTGQPAALPSSSAHRCGEHAILCETICLMQLVQSSIVPCCNDSGGSETTSGLWQTVRRFVPAAQWGATAADDAARRWRWCSPLRHWLRLLCWCAASSAASGVPESAQHGVTACTVMTPSP